MTAERRYEYLKSLEDIQTIRDLTEDSIRDILRKFTANHSLVITKCGEIEDMSGLNDAFNSTICSMNLKTLRHEEDDQEIEEEYNFVIKSPPRMSFVRQVHKLTTPFFNEVTWYLELIHQADLANGKGCMAHILPKCYYATTTSCSSSSFIDSCMEARCPWFCYIPCKRAEDGILILENIKRRPEKAYFMYDKTKPLPLDHVKVVVTQIAHFHGKWLKWKYMAQRGTFPPESGAWTWKTFEGTFNTQKRIPKVVYKQLSNVTKKITIKILKKKGEEEERENIVKCRNFFDKTAMDWLKSYMSRPDSPIHTLCHGDLWSNNILFSYNENGEVEDLNIIDYQLINYGHPCYDLVYFIYLNTDVEFRDNHLKEVLTLYHETFNPYIEETFGSEEEVARWEGFKYSFDDFMDDYNWHRNVGFTTACSVLPNVLSTSPVDLEANGLSALKELQRKQERELNDDTNPSTLEIRRRIVGLVHEMARDGFI